MIQILNVFSKKPDVEIITVTRNILDINGIDQVYKHIYRSGQIKYTATTTICESCGALTKHKNCPSKIWTKKDKIKGHIVPNFWNDGQHRLCLEEL